MKEKYEARKKIEGGCLNKTVAADYDIPPSTLSTWLKSKDKIVKAFKGGASLKMQRLKPCGNENLDQALYTWFVQMRQQGVPVSGLVLREKALRYAKEMDIKVFTASNSRFDRWKNRHDVAFKAISGEVQSCTLEMTASWKESTLPTLLSKYALRKIFNGDDFGLFYNPDIANLKAINLVFLPPNTTCKTEPMDQGVIRATKAYYHASVVRKFIDAVEKGKAPPNISVLDAMTILTGASHKVTPETMENCFKQAGICSEAQTNAINDLDNPSLTLSEEIQSAVPANVNADDVIGMDDAISTSKSSSLRDEEILAEFRSDQEAMEEDEGQDEVEVIEECPKKPTASEIRSAIDALTSYSLLVNEGAEEIRSHVQQIEALAEITFRSSQRQQTLHSFFVPKQ